jgi:peptide methionine sulfoxide reductase msrA/msrB
MGAKNSNVGIIITVFLVIIFLFLNINVSVLWEGGEPSTMNNEFGEKKTAYENVSSKNVLSNYSNLPHNPNLDVEFNVGALKDIWLAGGCFWGVEAYMSRIYGVYDVTSGYANGNTENPSYYDVVNGSGHAEAVHVRYDSEKVDLKTLLNYFFKVVNPTSLNKQGNDEGISYRSGIYYQNEEDLKVIEEVIKELGNKYSEKIVVEVERLKGYYLAEDYHQDYLEKNPDGYCHIEFDAIKNQEVGANNQSY